MILICVRQSKANLSSYFLFYFKFWATKKQPNHKYINPNKSRRDVMLVAQGKTLRNNNTRYLLSPFGAILFLNLSRQQFFQAVQGHSKSFLKAHFDHLFHTGERFIFNNDTHFGSSVMLAKS
jgi:hypothetical protein